jgi:hypothetical protein
MLLFYVPQILPSQKLHIFQDILSHRISEPLRDPVFVSPLEILMANVSPLLLVMDFKVKGGGLASSNNFSVWSFMKIHHRFKNA